MRSSTSSILRDIKNALRKINKLNTAMNKREPTQWQRDRMKVLEEEWKKHCRRLPQF